MYSNLDQLSLKGPFFNGFTYVFKITEKKKPIEIISPPLVIHSFNKEYNSLLVNCDYLCSKNNSLFIKYIYDLEKIIQKHQKKIDRKLKIKNNRKFRSVIGQWKGLSTIKFYLYNKDIEIYDIDKKKISLQSLNNKGTIKLLIWVKELIINNEQWFIKLSIMQVKFIDPLPPIGCVIDDEENKTDCKNTKTETNNQPSSYQKYFNMMKMGIPKQAVKNKCLLDGLDPNMIDKNPNQVTNPMSDRKLLLNDLTKVKLKKVDFIPTKKKTYHDKLQFGPSLDDIKNKLNSLRKTS